MNASITKFAKQLVTLVFALAISGCVGNGTVPEPRYYRLPDPNPTPETTPIIRTSLGIPRLTANGLYHERAMLHFLSDRPLDLRPYHYQFWNESPTLLIRDHLVDYLRAARATNGIVRFQEDGRAQQTINGRLLRFEREVAAESIRVHVVLEFSLDAGRTELLPPTRYAAHLAVPDDTMHSTVESFGRALETIYRQLLDDLRPTMR